MWFLLKVACSWKPYLGKCLFFFVDFSAASPLQGTLQQKQRCVIDKLNTKPASLAGFTTIQLIKEREKKERKNILLNSWALIFYNNP